MEELTRANFSFKSLFVPLTTAKAIIIIILVGLIVFSNALFNEFVWDDLTYIIKNPQVHQLNMPELLGRNLFNSAGFYRPIPALYFALLYKFFNTTTFFYHGIQLVLHITNSIFVYVLLKTFFRRSLSFFLSLIFLVHPINTESVIYVAASASVLLLFFGMYALLLNVRAETNIFKIFLIFFLILLSALTKETGLLFIPLLVIFQVLFNKAKYTRHILFAFLTASGYVIMRVATIGTQYVRQEEIPIMSLGLNERLLNIPQIIFYYLKTLLYPVNLAISQNWTIKTMTTTSFYIPLLSELVLIICSIFYGSYLYKNNKQQFKIYIFFFCWFALGMGMLLQIIPLDMTVADRWFYFPMVGLLGLIGTAIHSISIKNWKIKSIFITIAILIITTLSLQTIIRNSNWSDPMTLYSHDINIEDDYNKENGLGEALVKNGLYDQALIHFQKSVELSPNYANLNNLGVVYQHKGDIQKATYFYFRSLETKPDIASPYLNFAAIQVLYGNPDTAIPIIKNILLKEYPGIWRFWVLLAVADYKLNNSKEALYAAQKAYDLSQNKQTIYVLNLIKDRKPVQEIDNEIID